MQRRGGGSESPPCLGDSVGKVGARAQHRQSCLGQSICKVGAEGMRNHNDGHSVCKIMEVEMESTASRA